MTSDSRVPFNVWRRFKGTKLTMEIAAPGPQEPVKAPPGVETIVYRSGNLDLVGCFMPPRDAGPGSAPGILYSHGGCGIGKQDFNAARLFTDAGYAVFLPTYRGEHGNRGSYELFFGEVDDAYAALQHFGRLAAINARRLFAFGYSIGGEIAALLSLFESTRLLATGSYGPFFLRKEPFSSSSMFGAPVPFDVEDSVEVELRLLSYHREELACRHFAYVGRGDSKFLDGAWRRLVTEGGKLAINEVYGTHDSGLKPAIEEFIARIAAL